MNFAFAFLLTVGALPLLAQTPPPKADNFEKHKAMTLEQLDGKIAEEQKLRGCVAAAKSHDDMKSCHQNHENAMKQFESQHREHRKDQIDQQIKRLQDEKAKLDQTPNSGAKPTDEK